MNDAVNHPLAQIGSEPVSGENPCGENVRYEPVFESLEAELAKQESLSAATVDWKTVADLSSKILKESSKDLLVGCYLSQALLINESYSGLATGLKILNDMVEHHWDCLFPPAKRLRARQTPFVWLAEKAGEYIVNHAPSADDTVAVIAASDTLKQLDSVLVDKMGDQAPMMSDLSRSLKNYKQSAIVEQENNKPAPVEAQATEVPAAKVEQKKSVSASSPLAAGPVSSDAEAKKALRQLQESSRLIISYWQAKKLSDPRAYRLARMMTWMMIDVAPPSTDSVTQLNGPEHKNYCRLRS